MTDLMPNCIRLAGAVLAALIAFLAIQIAGAKLSAATGLNYDFAAQSQDAGPWLANQGFQLKLDAGNASVAHLSLNNHGLTIETLAPSEPIIAHPGLSIPQPARLSVTWGVNRYPAGANWDTGVNNEAIMVMVFFGTEKLSGGFFLPPSPYFIGYFLCENGRRSVAIAGRSYTAQGRYVCVDGPAPGKEITSEASLADSFRAAFRGATVPPVTGIAFEADTTQVGSNARSSAWIKSIQITPSN